MTEEEIMSDPKRVLAKISQEKLDILNLFLEAKNSGHLARAHILRDEARELYKPAFLGGMWDLPGDFEDRAQ
jgi:hypothetical protein